MDRFGSIVCITLTWRRPELEKLIEMGTGNVMYINLKAAAMLTSWSFSVKISDNVPQLSQREGFDWVGDLHSCETIMNLDFLLSSLS